MSELSQILPLAIGGILSWLVIAGIRELLKEASVALTKKLQT
ncbi:MULTISPECIES: hypothetical protein [Prochlorococcus]|nr:MULTISPECIES: hypothetical protein [Prochlorococcus]KGG12678.1 hypothetical protein EV05_1895 [Prochlorococcus sp. MIT 0601]